MKRLANPKCVEYALDIIERAHKFGKTVAFDVNYRTDIYKDTESAVKTYKKILSLADIVKFSEDEVEIFTEDYVGSLTDKLVLITLGKDGSEWRYKGKRNRMPSIAVKTIDTTGAGVVPPVASPAASRRNVKRFIGISPVFFINLLIIHCNFE